MNPEAVGKFHIIPPGEQFWDGLSDTEKSKRVLIVPKNKKDEQGNIKYEELVIHKYGKNNQSLSGVKFCIEKQLTNVEKLKYLIPELEGASDVEIEKLLTEEKIQEMLEKFPGPCDESYHKAIKDDETGKIIDYETNWVTNNKGILTIPTNELPLYNQTIIEIPSMQKTYKPIKIDIYVDPGNRFLGEVKGTDFITYKELLDQIGSDSVGTPLDLGNDAKDNNGEKTGGNWLKIYDAREEKTLYIAKKPITNNVSWGMLFNAGVVYGTDTLTQGLNHEYTYIDFGFKDGDLGFFLSHFK